MKTLELSFVRKRASAAIGVLAAVLTAAGCAAESEPDVVTENIKTRFVAQADGTSTLVYGSFFDADGRKGDAYPVEAVSVSVGGEEKRARLDRFATSFQYSFPNKSDGTVELSLMTSEFEELLYALFDLPEPFAPALDQTRVSRNETLVVELGDAASGVELEYDVEGDCIEGLQERVEDTAQLLIDTGHFVSAPGYENRGCTVTLTVTRSTTQVIDGEFEGADAIAQQVRQVTFEYSPDAS